MHKNIRTGILFAAGISFILLLFIYLASKGINWQENYIKDKKHAKGTYFLAKLLQHYQPKSHFIELDAPLHKSLKNKETPSNYIFIGTEIYLPDEDLKALHNYVQNGNSAFLFCHDFSYEFMESLTDSDSTLFNFFPINNQYSKGIATYLNDSNLYAKVDSAFAYNKYGFGKRYWNYINLKDIDSINGETLGTLKVASKSEQFEAYISDDSVTEGSLKDTLIEGVNFFRIPYGKGFYYIHTNPILFCNAPLIERENLGYINGVFAYLNKGDILWEEHNWVFGRPYLKSFVPYTKNYSPDESILKMILENKELKWGWYTLLFMAFLFVIFNGKRKQATIPLLPDFANTTLIQLKKTGTLFKDNADYFDITQDMFENFLWFIHVKLNIDTHQTSDKIISDILKQTNYDPAKMHSIFTRYQKIENWKSVTHGVFLDLHRDIENFYSSLK